MEKLQINLQYLDELIQAHSAKTVGKILKRCEICPTQESLKPQIKEILYESYRDFRDLLVAHNYGLNAKEFKFTSPRKGE